MTKSLATFRFIGDKVDPDVITSLLHIVPTRAHRKGETIARRPGAARATGLWGLESKLPLQAPLEDHLDSLLAQLEPHANDIRQLIVSGLSCDFHCSYFAQGHSSRLQLSSVTLSRVSALGVHLSVDFYCDTDDGNEAPSESSSTS